MVTVRLFESLETLMMFGAGRMSRCLFLAEEGRAAWWEKQPPRRL